MHILSRFRPVVSFIAISLLFCRSALAQESFEGWNLETGIAQAHLVMVARVDSISKVTVVEGAKTNVSLREYRFQPVRLLKGIFQRDQLSMTASDLGCPADDAAFAPPLREGEIRLLILSQQSSRPSGSTGCVAAAPGATTFEQRVPLLTGIDDPLVAVVETLIKVADSRSRRERAKLLIGQLVKTSDIATVPLLTSLKLRADCVASEGLTYSPIEDWEGNQPAPAKLTSLVRHRLPAVRRAVVELLSEVLEFGSGKDDSKQQVALSVALIELLKSDEADANTRVNAIKTLGQLAAVKIADEAMREWLINQLTEAATYAERNAALIALSYFARTEAMSAGLERFRGPEGIPSDKASKMKAATAIMNALAALPLDALPAYEVTFARISSRLLPPDDHRQLLDDVPTIENPWLARLERSINAGQPLAVEVDALAQLRSKNALPLLLKAANQSNLSQSDRIHIARAFGKFRDDQTVPILVSWLRWSDYQLKEAALATLELLDSPPAAQELRPLLKSEAYLPYKLRMARLLARHGFADGYALATEHLADAENTAAATLVLAALDDPRAVKELTATLTANPDRRWHAAALSGLATMQDAAALKQLHEILDDDRHPLVAEAANAAGLTADNTLLQPLSKLTQSRNQQIAMSSLIALRRLLSDVRSSPRGLAVADFESAKDNDDEPLPLGDKLLHDPAAMAAIADSAASLALDTYVSADMRIQSFAVARLVGGEGYSQLLAKLADQSELEGSPLLEQANRELRRLRNKAD